MRVCKLSLQESVKDNVKEFGVIYTGAIGSITISQVLPYVSLTVGLLTIIYTVLKIVDWCEARQERKNKKN
jgi:hypothetical protein